MNGPKAYGAALLFVVSYCLLSITPRAEFGQLIGLYTVLFAIYGLALYRGAQLSLKQVAILAIAVRIPWFFNLPLLSDDFYRFLWDGLLLIQGVNPFGIVPSAMDLSMFHDSEFAAVLLQKMNSPGYPSVYPPVHQAVFASGAVFSGNADYDLSYRLLAGVNGMRLCIWVAEAGMLWYFLKSKGLKMALISAYLLNPLVVAEGVGNVHLEAILTPLLAISLHLFLTGKLERSGGLWAGAIATKLTPLMLAPVFAFRLPPKALLKFGLSSAFFTLLAFVWFKPWEPLFTEGNGLSLYFVHFEFNASFYYFIRFTTSSVIGYNPIGILGPILGGSTLIILLAISYKRRVCNLYEVGLIMYIVYYLLATTVHSWYLIPIVFLALVSGRKLVLIWSFTVWLSYAHYLHPVGPPTILLAVEYLALFLAFFLENKISPWFKSKSETTD